MRTDPPTHDTTPIDVTETQLKRACGAGRWVNQMLALSPFKDVDALWAAVEATFAELNRDDWLEAFADHPRIGDVDKLRERFAHSGDLSETEQAGLADADEAVLTKLHALNVAYEARFGHVFLICASGKQADEMLEALEARYDNDSATELANAAQEQEKITRLRLEASL